MSIFQDIHLYLVTSFLLMVYLIYKFGCKNISGYISNGISEIKSELDSLNKKKETLEYRISKLSSELSDAEKNYEKVLDMARLSAEGYIRERNLQMKDLVQKLEAKNQQTVRTIEHECVMKIKSKLTDLIINRLLEKIRNPENVKKVSLTSITNVVHSINQLTKQ